MLGLLWLAIKTFFIKLKSNGSFSSFDPFSAESIILDLANEKIKKITGKDENVIDFFAYKKYFDFFDKLGLKEDFKIITSTDTEEKLTLYGSIINPLLINENNNKIIIFCHGVTNNRWTLFYVMHLTLQRGYKVLTYDARNHGASDKSNTTLGQIESCDLQDIIVYARKRFSKEKILIGCYGFSMGSSTLLYWLGHFAGPLNKDVRFIICDSSFDFFSKQRKFLLGTGINYYWKHYLINKAIDIFLKTSNDKLEKLKPFLSIPDYLPIKILFLHGNQDIVINWESSYDIYHRLRENEFNKKKVNLYLCDYADHGDLPFIADRIPETLIWMEKKRKSSFNFTNLYLLYLKKNF